MRWRARASNALAHGLVKPDALIDAWAHVTAARDRQGRPIATGDAWIAATAWVQGLPLVTHNRRHFAGIEGLEVVSAQL
jgi:predicted nucleic acid-binding protein